MPPPRTADIVDEVAQQLLADADIETRDVVPQPVCATDAQASALLTQMYGDISGSQLVDAILKHREAHKRVS